MHRIHIHTVVMKVPVICFWVLIPPRQFACVKVRGSSRERKTSVTVTWVRDVFWSDAYRLVLCLHVPHTDVTCVGVHTICVYAWTCLFDWLRAYVFVSRECVFERRYLRAAGSPKASTLHPWPGSTGALSSVSRLTWNWREEDRHCCHSSDFYLLFFLFPPFILLC